jgi:hypothetical protein
MLKIGVALHQNLRYREYNLPPFSVVNSLTSYFSISSATHPKIPASPYSHQNASSHTRLCAHPRPLGLQALTANCKPLGILSRGLQNGTHVSIDPILMDGLMGITTIEVDGRAESTVSLIAENPGNLTKLVDEGNARLVEYKPPPEEEAREQHDMDEWHQQIAAEVMQVLALKKRDAEVVRSMAEAEVEWAAWKGVPNVWKRYISILRLIKCWHGQWNGTTCLYDNGKQVGLGSAKD